MTIELHIWGPAFGLPSIDAKCLAVIAYLRESLPSDQWRLIPSTPAENPLCELPALKDDKRWIAGFADIVDYLRENCAAASDIDEHLSPNQAAQRTAYASFILSRGQPLLDLSLYVSSENYSTCTKPALALLLQWPDSWFVPHRLRDQAKKRSEHLGLNGLDVDSAQSEGKEEGLAAQIPDSLKKPKQTVSALLGRDTRKSKFRLDAVTVDFFGPLDELLGEGPWLISDRPTSVDCLAAGYLALMQASASDGQPWLCDALSKKFPNLSKWSQTRKREWFGEVVSASAIRGADAERHVLPWHSAADRTPGQLANSLAQNVAGAIPFLNSYLAPPAIIVSETTDSPKEYYKQKQNAINRLQNRSLLQSQVITSTVTASILAGILFYNGLLRLPYVRRAAANTRGFGAAGDLLGLR